MRNQTKTFVENFLKEKGSFARVLDVGSRDINGHLRDYFQGVSYIGADMIEGPNVDVLVNGHNLVERFKKNSFDLVLCFDTFEHDDRFWETSEQCREVLKPGGYFLVGMPGRNCPEHDWPQDFWRFMPQSIAGYFLRGYEDVYTETQIDTPGNAHEDEVIGYGRKPAQ